MQSNGIKECKSPGIPAKRILYQIMNECKNKGTSKTFDIPKVEVKAYNLKRKKEIAKKVNTKIFISIAIGAPLLVGYLQSTIVATT